MKTADEIVRGKDSETLRAALKDIWTLHEEGQVGDGPFRKLKSEIESGGHPAESSLRITESAVLMECARRWAQFATGKPSEALLQISRTAAPEGDEMQVEISAEGNHVRLALPMEDFARIVTGEAHIPVEVRRWVVVK